MRYSAELMMMLTKIQDEAKALIANKDTTAEQIEAKTAEITTMKAKLKMQLDLEAEEMEEMEAKMKNGSAKPLETSAGTPALSNGEMELKVFAKALAGIPMNGDMEIKALSTLTDKDGKLLIPADVKTAINTWLRQYTDMSTFVQRESTKMVSGSRIFEVEAEATPFGEVAELTTIPDMGSPEFQKISYACNYYKGMLKIPNELLKNEAGNLMDYVAQWIAKKQVATRNILAFYANGTKAQGILGTTTDGISIDKTLTLPVTLKYLDKLLHVGLPMAIYSSPECRIYTNQTGFNYYLSLEDKQGKKYLQQDVTNPAIYRYDGKQIVVFDDKQLKNEEIETKMQFPTIVGNLKEAMKMFELEGFLIESDRSRYFDEDATGMRVIGALDTKLFDKKAVKAYYSPVE